MRILFLFFDGIGLGRADAPTNPFARASLPIFERLAGGQRWLDHAEPVDTGRALFIPTDACLGVAGKPQSATGQATILTGINVPELIGRHYGPKPNAEIATIVTRESVVRRLVERGCTASLLNAYPSQYLDSIQRGKRMLSSNQLALQVAGVEMLDGQALLERRALSADFIGELWRVHAAYNDAASRVWRAHPDSPDTPVMTAHEAGILLAELASQQDFAFFDYWLTDYIGHRGTIEQGAQLLEIIDGVFDGLLTSWDDSSGIIVITSDHGNLEALDERGHTRNRVPTVIVGEARHAFADGFTDLTGFAPALLRVLGE